MLNKFFMSFFIAGASLYSLQGEARILSNVEIYKRCYAQFTQQAVPYNNAALLQVKNGTKTPVAACMELLDRAKFNTTGNYLNTPTDPIAVSILNTMNQVHQTFFLSNTLTENSFSNSVEGMKGIYDAGEPALYYTKALFDAATNFNYVVTANVNLRADRTGNNPAVSTEGINRTASTFNADPEFSWASIGQLLGVKATGLMTITAAFIPTPVKQHIFDAGATRGGGILGTPTYLLETVSEPEDLKANSLSMPRKWAKSVISDFLCRELPVARLADTDSFVVSTPTTAHEFRKSSSCTQCHASMDRLAAVNRNFKYISMRPNPPTTTVKGGVFPITWTTNATLNGSEWPAVVTANYAERPTLGVLYYRDYLGNLVNQPISSIADLGTKLATQDDFYICAAKKYYQYFTGVNVDIIDPSDARIRNKGADMTTHKNNVVTLGLALKTHQNLRTLINSILNLDIYKKSDLGIQGL